MARLINCGSVDDIKCSIKNGLSSFTIDDLENEINEERTGRNRATVIKLIEGAIKNKLKQQSL